MWDEYTANTLARLKQEEYEREAAQYRLASLAEQRPERHAMRRRLASILMAFAARLAPLAPEVAPEPVIDVHVATEQAVL